MPSVDSISCVTDELGTRWVMVAGQDRFCDGRVEIWLHMAKLIMAIRHPQVLTMPIYRLNEGRKSAIHHSGDHCVL